MSSSVSRKEADDAVRIAELFQKLSTARAGGERIAELIIDVLDSGVDEVDVLYPLLVNASLVGLLYETLGGPHKGPVQQDLQDRMFEFLKKTRGWGWSHNWNSVALRLKDSPEYREWAATQSPLYMRSYPRRRASTKKSRKTKSRRSKSVRKTQTRRRR
jgi:hypothetical protein